MNDLSHLLASCIDVPTLGIAVNEMKSPLIQFADDIALVAKNESQLDLFLQKCEEHSFANHYKFNTSNSFLFAKGNRECNLRMYNEELKCVKTFKYFGISLTMALTLVSNGIKLLTQLNKFLQFLEPGNLLEA